MKTGSWENVEDWYKNLVGTGASYYHENIVIPNTLRLLDLKSDSFLLDLACGEGVLERNIPKEVKYLGIDLSQSLINSAKQNLKTQNHSFITGDISDENAIPKNKYTHAIMILALQNIKDYTNIFFNVAQALDKGGKFIIVLNHPYFRNPKHTSWESDLKNGIQYRRVEKYMTATQNKIYTNPGLGEDSEYTISYHNTLESYTKSLYKNGLYILKIEEWISDKTSKGRHAEMENTARKEIPMFMCILCQKANLL